MLELDLLGGEVVGIDGSYFNGNASEGSIYSKEKIISSDWQNKIDTMKNQVKEV